jgi:uncharacterized membrane protein YesL
MNKIVIIFIAIVGLVYAGYDTIPQETVQLHEIIRPITPTVIGAVLTSHGGTFLISFLILFGLDGFPNRELAFACLFTSWSEVIVGTALLRFRVAIARDSGMTKPLFGIAFDF